MPYVDELALARRHLEAARHAIQVELRAYVAPVSGCDAHFNRLIGLRGSISDAQRALITPRFVNTPRTPNPQAGVESR